MWVDGRIYYGMWKDGQQHGEGTMILPNMAMKKSYWENGVQTTRLKLGETETEQITKYVKEMQANDADERRSMVLEGGLTRSQTFKMKNSHNRKPSLALAVVSQHVTDKLHDAMQQIPSNQTGTFGNNSSPNSNTS